MTPRKPIFGKVARPSLIAVALILVGGGVATGGPDPLDAPMRVVTWGADDTIRDVVGKYLSDPDLWPVVLSLNGMSSPADLRPGATLRLPVQQVAAADGALGASLAAIQKANAEGARIFAPAEIGSAIENREAAVSEREAGAWRQVVSFAGVAEDFANEALEISIAERDRAAEAVVSDVQGAVEGRAPADPAWSARDLNDVLVEFERVRTLSASTTQITFRDLSRLRLNANSNATIQRMRSDPLTGGEVTKVSLVDGDFYALLNQLSDNSTFEIEVPGVESTTNSADFWIKNDQSGARFVNYDRQEMEIRQGGDAIMLGENQGVVISPRGTETAEVLSSPSLGTPTVGQVIYTTDAELSWQALDGAAAYWLEVARDPGFNRMQLSQWGIRDTGFAAGGLTPGRYHWRVAALDRLGLPGAWSTPADFTVRVDTTPPFLTLLSPAPGAIVATPEVEVLGASEPDATLLLNGRAVMPGADGSFLVTQALIKGENDLDVLAIDPAGNRTRRSQTVIYRPAESIEISLSQKLPRIGEALVSRTERLSVTARSGASEGAAVVVRDASGKVIVRTLAGPGGEIGFSVPVDAAPRGYRIEVLAPGGRVEGARAFTALRDSEAPKVKLDLPPPRVTGEPFVQLAGSADDAVWLELNGTTVPLAAGRFDLTMQLQPGENGFDLSATDGAGNVSVTRLRVLLDIDPPDILRVDLARPDGVAGPVEIVAEARDASGLVQAAPFVIAIGGTEVSGFLRCDSDSGLCRATLPPQPGALELIELEIDDYAGNAAFE